MKQEEMPFNEQFELNIDSRRMSEKLERYKAKAKEAKKKSRVSAKMKKTISKRADEMLKQFGLE